ncbi:hypothetical protein CALVIDRAFT_344558 [Calocera viscosa TUFC12733]|uniref:Uncharacterized protein n=1 Tax=Calocera viscosa (strain TUFC12733) TaxID=1330018 RepID=A0A167HDJ0_CALVF|nr:hypothetical protein CALVIDRAFT_344558 [Calocera viscosa TUFC12733]
MPARCIQTPHASFASASSAPPRDRLVIWLAPAHRLKASRRNKDGWTLSRTALSTFLLICIYSGFAFKTAMRCNAQEQEAAAAVSSYLIGTFKSCATLLVSPPGFSVGGMFRSNWARLFLPPVSFTLQLVDLRIDADDMTCSPHGSGMNSQISGIALPYLCYGIRVVFPAAQPFPDQAVCDFETLVDMASILHLAAGYLAGISDSVLGIPTVWRSARFPTR